MDSFFHGFFFYILHNSNCSFFGMYEGTGGRKNKNEVNNDEVQWAHSSRKDLLQRVHVQTQETRGRRLRQQGQGTKGKARRRRSLTGQQMI